MGMLIAERVKPKTVNMFGTCKECGWVAVEVCCNDGFLDNLKDSYGDESRADWFCYCLNKGCEHHKGYEVGQGCEEPSENFIWEYK